MTRTATRKNSGAMRIFAVVFCLTIGCVCTAQAMEVEGTAYLSGGNPPQGIMVIFTEASPSAHSDTAFTDAHGIFDLYLQTGWYDVTYRHFGYADFVLGLIYLRSNLTMQPVTLMPPLRGRLNGTIGPGDFHVTDSLYVAPGETAALLPGTHLYFDRVVPFYIAGRLTAVGTETDSILFSRRYSTGYQATWRGITFSDADPTSQLQFVVIEHAIKAEYRNGGGLYAFHTDLGIMQTTFRYDHGDYGGGAFFENCAPRAEGCLFVENIANGGAGLGLRYSGATVTDCRFQGNSATYSGGGIYADGSSVMTISRCQFVGNAAFDGAGVAVLARRSRLPSPTWSSRFAPHGPARPSASTATSPRTSTTHTSPTPPSCGGTSRPRGVSSR